MIEKKTVTPGTLNKPAVPSGQPLPSTADGSFFHKENYKWMHPCYTINNKNAVLIHGFKGYVALLFQKGAILEEKYHTLIQQTERLQAEAVP